MTQLDTSVANDPAQHLYEKCGSCHLFVEENHTDEPGLAKWLHSHRGDDVDVALDESHEAWPSGMKANLLTWQVFGPSAMRERFVLFGINNYTGSLVTG